MKATHILVTTIDGDVFSVPRDRLVVGPVSQPPGGPLHCAGDTEVAVSGVEYQRFRVTGEEALWLIRELHAIGREASPQETGDRSMSPAEIHNAETT